MEKLHPSGEIGRDCSPKWRHRGKVAPKLGDRRNYCIAWGIYTYRDVGLCYILCMIIDGLVDG